MRYLDPESISNKRMPTNYDSRAPDIRPKRFGGPRNGADQEKWARGADARPSFDRGTAPRNGGGRYGDDLDRVKIRRGERPTDGQEAGDNVGREGRKRDWDDWRTGRAQQYGERFERGREGDRGDSRAKGGLDYRSRSRSGSREKGEVRSRSRSRTRSRSPVMRAESERGGDRSEGESDMVMDDDD